MDREIVLYSTRLQDLLTRLPQSGASILASPLLLACSGVAAGVALALATEALAALRRPGAGSASSAAAASFLRVAFYGSQK